ncbi:MAG: polymerase sigma-70 factor, subfamily [Bryobacterales bacterium]|jgi:RNA polymerase sigma-70 factor (ECF subfamily)|nr:polymerase sigma-70 factor, subfamily [Bryobacterales bacterium]
MPQSEEITLSKVRGGDRDAFRALVDQHARTVFRLAYRMTGNETDAEDMVQETFLRAWKQIGKFDGRATFGTWLHRICTNCALDHLRLRQRRQAAQPAYHAGEDQSDPVALVAAESPSPERLAMSSQISAILGPALEELTEMERAAFILRHYEGMGIEEISVELGVQPGAAKHSVFRAVQKLRRVLEPAMANSR